MTNNFYMKTSRRSNVRSSRASIIKLVTKMENQYVMRCSGFPRTYDLLGTKLESAAKASQTADTNLSFVAVGVTCSCGCLLVMG